jgi:hypothetical protein
LKHGDQILIAGENTANVKCIIEIQQTDAKPIIFLPESGLWITQDHPIKIDGNWKYANQVESFQSISNTFGKVYGLVLNEGHIALVNNIECITWGHNIEKVAHYFNQEHKIISYLRKYKWYGGHVVINEGSALAELLKLTDS